MDIQSAPALATPMPAPARARYAASAHNALHLTPADIAELDPMATGSIDLLGLTYVREA